MREQFLCWRITDATDYFINPKLTSRRTVEIEFSKDDKRDYVTVPKALLEMCFGLLNEFSDAGTLVDEDDLMLAIEQLRVAIAE